MTPLPTATHTQTDAADRSTGREPPKPPASLDEIMRQWLINDFKQKVMFPDPTIRAPARRSTATAVGERRAPPAPGGRTVARVSAAGRAAPLGVRPENRGFAAGSPRTGGVRDAPHA